MGGVHRVTPAVEGTLQKELITLLLDPSVRRILFVPILAQSILFGYGATFNLEEAPYVLYDASQTPDSRALSARLEANRIFKRAAEVPSAQAFTAAVADGRALVGFWIPEDFAQKLARGETAPVYVAADARNTTTANVAVGYAAAIIEEFNASRQVRSVLELKDRYRYNENGITRWNIMTGLILGLAMIQVMLLAGLAVSREREEGSFDMMLMTPLTPVEILIGKAVPPIVIGVLQSAMIFAVCRWWFDIPFAGSLALLFGVVLLFAASIVGLGAHDFRLGADTAAVGCSMLHSAAAFARPLRPHDADSCHARMDADHYPFSIPSATEFSWCA